MEKIFLNLRKHIEPWSIYDKDLDESWLGQMQERAYFWHKGYFEFPPSTSDATRDFINACKLSADIKNVEELLDAPTLYKIAKKALMKRRESTCING